VDASSAIFLDPILISEKLPEYQGWNAMLLHAEACHILLDAELRARVQGLNIILKTTMRVKEETEERLRLYKETGYEICCYFMFAAPETAAKRAMDRFVEAEKRGEKAPYYDLESIFRSTTNEATFDAVKGSFEYWALYNNNKGPSPNLVAQGGLN
jgi:hypothetical protein